MPKVYLRQDEHIVLVDHLQKTKTNKKTGGLWYVYQNELGISKACFQHGMAYDDFKDLTWRIASDKMLRDKVFNIAKNPKCGWYQRGLASVVYKFFDKKLPAEELKMKIFLIKN